MATMPMGSVVVVSDRCARGEETDRSGPVLVAGLADAGMAVRDASIVPDDPSQIKRALSRALDSGARVVLVSGGTGVSPQDVTADAVAPFFNTPLPGLTHALYGASLAETKFAALSRAEAGLTAGPPPALVVTLAGSVNAAETTIRVVGPLIGHLLSQLDRDAGAEGGYVAH